MDLKPDHFRNRVESLKTQWEASGLPSRAVLDAAAEELLSLRLECRSPGLWDVPPLMITATIDDGLGQGLTIIHRFAEAVGMKIRSLGLLQSPEHIISVCRKEKPDFVGLTVLQFDSEEALTTIAAGMPRNSRLICGGPVFNADPEFAERCGVHFVARHVGVFLDTLLTLSQKREL